MEALSESAPVLLWVAEPGAGAIHLNRAWSRLTGIAHEDAMGSGWALAIHEEDRDRILAAVNDSLANAEPFELEYRIRDSRGEYRRVLGRGVPHVRSNGSSEYLVCSALDITELVEAEARQSDLLAELELERSRLREAFERAPAFIATLSGPKHIIESANPRMLQLAGRPNVVGSSASQVFPELVDQGYIEILDDVFRTGRPFIGNEMRLDVQEQSSDSTRTFYFSFVYEPMQNLDGGVSGIFVHGVDVTEQVLARQQIETHAAESAEASRKLNLLAEASRVLASTLEYRKTLDNLAHLVVANLADWCTICLVQENGEVVRVSAVHSDERMQPLLNLIQQGSLPTEEAQPLLFEVLRTGATKLLPVVGDPEASGVTRDPDQIDLLRRIGLASVVVVPLNSGSTTVGAIFMARSDIHAAYDDSEAELALELGRRAAAAVENARLHQKTRELNEELERRVQDRTSELERANAKLEQEITERRRAERELQNRELQLSRAQRMTHLGSWAWKPDRDELFWSEETHRIFGYPGEIEPTFDLFMITVAQADRESIKAIIFDAIERKVPFSFEHAIVRADGSAGYVRSDGEVSVDDQGEVTELFGTVLDITKAKAAEEALRDSEMRFRFLAENALHIVGTVRRDGVIGYMSPSARQVMGYEPHQLVGTNCLELVHPDDLKSASREFQRLLGNPGKTFRLSYRYRHGNGEWRVLEVLGKLPETDSQSAIINAHDITDRVSADAEIRALNDELKSRSLQLSTTNEELEAFAYSVSHDLRAPLRGIDGFCQALVEDYSGQLDKTANGYLHRIRAGAARMGELIDDLLDLSRLSRSKIVRESVDLSELASQIGADLASREPDRRVDLVVEPGLVADGDRRLLVLLLENLLENAWKFTRRKDRARVEVGRKDAGGATAYYVRDNGAGFDMQYVKRLFGAFQRLHSNDEFEGTGIGLATVQRIVSRHGGRIWAEGAVDEGATFYFTIDQRGWRSLQV
jgi:PAS domain S-box-containing protein